MTSPSPSELPAPEPVAQPLQTCASCGAQTSGRFCSECGASLASTSCASCGAQLASGAKFCHRCGVPVGAPAPGGRPADPGSGAATFSSALPWGVAAIALVALVALVAGQRFAGSANDASGPPPAGADAAPFAGAAAGRAPDISNLSPEERASRLYNRVMAAHERGAADTVQMFAPMAIAAYQMIGDLSADQHFDLGRLAAVSGNEPLAKAEADTILAAHPNHLLGLILAVDAARLRHDGKAARTFHERLVAAAPTERATKLPEYAEHANDITLALSEKLP